MKSFKNSWFLFGLFSLALVVSGKRSGDRDDDNGLLPRPSRNKQNAPERKPELFAGVPDPESSAQQISPAISGYQGNLGNQNGLLGNQGLYAGLQGQGINPNLGQGQVGFNPYLSGLGTSGLGGTSFGIGQGFQNPYSFFGTGQQDIYSQQGGLSGIYSQQAGLGGLYNTNPYLLQGQNPYLTNPYLQGAGAGGFSTQYLNGNGGGVNPYVLNQRNPGYIANPYLGLGGGGSVGGGFINPYSFNTLNPYNSFPLTSRFGFGAGRGSLGSRSNSAGSSSSSSSNDE